MRNLLALIGLAVVVFLGAGYYFGWYKFDSSTKLDGTKDLHLQVDTDKLKKDVQTGVNRVEEAGANAADSLKKNQPAEATSPATPR